MAKFSMKKGGKEVGNASVYAEPHTMDGKAMKTNNAKVVDPNTLSANSINNSTPALRVSAGDPGANDVKTSGIKIRGTGAATKGVMARGPMA
jgi:lipoate-protein ligase A